MPEYPLPEHDTTAIVLLGSFNPRIFQPAWLVAQGLLAPEEGTAANIEILNNDICVFETDWCRVEVLGDRLTLRSTAAPIVEALRDLMVGTFRILQHTPVAKIGLNTYAHFTLPNEQLWHRVGHLLVPKEQIWEPVLKNPGTRTLIVEGERTDGHDGCINVRVEPSRLIANALFIETNDEFRRPDANSANWAVEVLESEWDNYRHRAEQVRQQLLAKALEMS